MTIHKKLDKLLVENLNEVLAMHNRGIKLTFTDITAIRTIMETYLFSNQEGAVALRCGSFVFLSNTKRRASKSPAFVV